MTWPVSNHFTDRLHGINEIGFVSLFDEPNVLTEAQKIIYRAGGSIALAMKDNSGGTTRDNPNITCIYERFKNAQPSAFAAYVDGNRHLVISGDMEFILDQLADSELLYKSIVPELKKELPAAREEVKSYIRPDKELG